MISVIIPAYNVAPLLERCYQSIQTQTYKDFEVILIDDGSTDQTPEICEELAKNNANTRVVHQKNSGVSAARNKGIEIASGDYLCFIDSDDYVEPEYLQSLYHAIESADADLAECDQFGKSMLIKEDIMDSPSKIIDAILGYGKRENNQAVWNKLFKKTVIQDLRFPVDIFLGEDTLFCVEYAKRCKKGVHVHKGLYHYEEPTASNAYRSDPKLLKKYLTYIESRRRMLKDISMLSVTTVRYLRNSYLKSIKDSYFIARAGRQWKTQLELCSLVASVRSEGINIYRSDSPFTYFFMAKGPKVFDLWMLLYGKYNGLLQRLNIR